MGPQRWKMHVLVAGLAVTAMVVAFTPAVADPLAETDEYRDVVVLARNDVPFDAQTAASIAAQLGAPMFITNPAALSEAAAAGIADANPDVIIVAGGTAAIADAVADAAAEQCSPTCEIDRRFGVGRDETAAALAGASADYGLDRPVLVGENQVVGDVHIGGTAHVDRFTVQDTEVVSGLNADTVDSIDSDQLLLPDSLPSGRTLRGIYGVEDNSEGSTAHAYGSEVSFQVPLPADIDSGAVHFIPVGTSPPAECPGTITDPQAAPGHLCVYERRRFGYESVTIWNPVDNVQPGADRYGFLLLANDDTGAGTMRTWGSWAVTAP